MVFLGLDFGTQSLKVTVFNPESNDIFWKDFEYPSSLGSTSESYLERDIDMYWDITVSSIRYLIIGKKINPMTYRVFAKLPGKS